MVAVFDVLKAGKEFLGYMIADPAMINSFSFDKILITPMPYRAQQRMKHLLTEKFKGINCISSQ